MTHGPMVIGLVGGIGAGKSTVADCLAEAGCEVVRADRIAHKVLGRPEVIARLVAMWGDAVLDHHGAIDRGRLAGIALHDTRERGRLEALLHPLIKESCRQAIASVDPTVRAVILDAPLLLEAGLGDWCDHIVFIDAPEGARHARAEARHGWIAGEAARREALQMPLDEKRRKSDHVLVNAEDRASIRRQLAGLLDRLHPRTD